MSSLRRHAVQRRTILHAMRADARGRRSKQQRQRRGFDRARHRSTRHRSRAPAGSTRSRRRIPRTRTGPAGRGTAARAGTRIPRRGTARGRAGLPGGSRTSPRTRSSCSSRPGGRSASRRSGRRSSRRRTCCGCSTGSRHFCCARAWCSRPRRTCPRYPRRTRRPGSARRSAAVRPQPDVQGAVLRAFAADRRNQPCLRLNRRDGAGPDRLHLLLVGRLIMGVQAEHGPRPVRHDE